MRPQWVSIDEDTAAMEVPGGLVIRSYVHGTSEGASGSRLLRVPGPITAVALVFVPGVELVGQLPELRAYAFDPLRDRGER